MDSNPQSSSCCPDHEHNHTHDHTHDHHHSSTPSTSSADSTATSSSNEQQEQGTLSLEQAAQLVRYNAFGDAFEDLASAAVRGASMPHSHVGCWPAFSLFNHSCVPNTVHYVVGDNMVVRATEDVHAGEPACRNKGVPPWRRLRVCWGRARAPPGGGGPTSPDGGRAVSALSVFAL